MNTNQSSSDQFVAFETLAYHFTPGFRVGVGTGSECDWGAKLSYTRFYTETEDTVAGYVTPIFLGNRMAAMFLLPQPNCFNDGNIQATIDYNVLDLDFGKSFSPFESLRLRPVLGVRGAWINQNFDAEFQYTWPNTTQTLTSDERIENSFWGIGPKLGIENSLNLWAGEKCRLDLTLNFYTAYLLGFWAINDVTTNASSRGESPYDVPINDRHFGALTFQAMIGVNLNYRHWNATAGYEINDWLNQCQFFDYGTGPHNNDLVLQGLSIRVSYAF